MAATFAALISISAQVTIPIGIVPITLQVIVVYLVLALVGPWYGALAMLVYLLLGAAGLPVFAGFGAGETVLFGPTGGYLFAYPVACLLGGLVAGKRAKSRKADTLKVSLGCLVGIGLIYLLGVVWLSNFTGGFVHAIELGFIPFVPVDLLKAVFAVPVAVRLRWSNLQLPTNFSSNVSAGT